MDLIAGPCRRFPLHVSIDLYDGKGGLLDHRSATCWETDGMCETKTDRKRWPFRRNLAIHKRRRKKRHFYFSYFIASKKIPLRQSGEWGKEMQHLLQKKKERKKRETFRACARLRHRRQPASFSYTTTSQKERKGGIMLFQPDSRPLEADNQVTYWCTRPNPDIRPITSTTFRLGG